MLYQQILIADGSLVGEPGPLPYIIENLSDAVVADINASLGAQVAAEVGLLGMGFIPMSRKIRTITFKQRLTAAERIAIRAASASDPIIADFLDLLASSTLVDLDHADTVNGLAYMVSQALIESGRPAEIRA